MIYRISKVYPFLLTIFIFQATIPEEKSFLYNLEQAISFENKKISGLKSRFNLNDPQQTVQEKTDIDLAIKMLVSPDNEKMNLVPYEQQVIKLYNKGNRHQGKFQFARGLVVGLVVGSLATAYALLDSFRIMR